MIVASFMFKPLRVDRVFEEFNDAIEEIAVATAGYLGRKKWMDSEGNVAVMYYWESMEALKLFEKDPTHRVAKSRYSEWYEGYRVEISEVVSVYGDGFFDDAFPTRQI